MKCKYCDTEMFVDSVAEKENQEIFSYKCPNKNCVNYGYKNSQANSVEMAERK